MKTVMASSSKLIPDDYIIHHAIFLFKVRGTIHLAEVDWIHHTTIMG